ncbi:MAG TPA: efflux RND transporter periplasmic adaptor subunit [Burkholderiaceae bacterium]|nr:efflux RND transporter periplasmic adaptor subunit [Burkholderiaceae bacterium]
MSRLHRLFAHAAVAFAASGGLAGCSPSPAPAATAPPAPQVTVLTIQPRLVTLTSELPGRTSPTLIAEVRPQVTGLVKSRNFQEGAEVTAGMVLYQLDPATYEAALESARAAKARAEAVQTSARIKAKRMQELVEIKFVSQQDYDDAAAQLQQADADVAAATAAVDSARINLGYTKVTAPISGRIGKSAVTPGALVTANQAGALAVIQRINPIYVDVTQSSADLLRLKRAFARGELKRAPNNAARVALLLEDGTPYDQEGSLQFSDLTVDQTTGAITLRALFPNARGELLPGMYVRAVIEVGVREGAIVVPQQAVARDNKGDPIAMVVGADSKVELRKLQTARTLGSEWLIDTGLRAGDRVVIEGLQRARPGTVVQAVEAQPGAPAVPVAPPPAAKETDPNAKGSKS